jgi:hypothetical protein
MNWKKLLNIITFGLYAVEEIAPNSKAGKIAGKVISVEDKLKGIGGGNPPAAQ